LTLAFLNNHTALKVRFKAFELQPTGGSL